MKELALTISGNTVNVPNGVPDLSSGISLDQIVGVIFGVLFFVAILLTIVYLIWGGIDYITSTGDKNKIHAAKDKIIYAIIGLIVVILSFFIIRMFGFFFNLSLV